MVRENHDLGFAENTTVELQALLYLQFIDRVDPDEFDVQGISIIVIDALLYLDLRRTELFYLLLCHCDSCHYLFINK